ncbi:alanyl-tRNA synthetase [Ceratobasidium sp. AG-Ba]|nr:alanyl-tRNA synthetase [Ceratobasidium sp. AG-Ba]
MYVEEAKDYDSELVEGENRNLDLMLVFASIFSAILTAFIIESKNLLQEDTSDVSVTLLLAIAQSQQRIEQGETQILPLVQRPLFTPTLSARCINGLWFTSLALSLSAALIAMLAKEWLIAFTATRPRPAHAHSMVHQARLQGLMEWRARNIIDLLPTMLHLSLLLFSLGLAVYLWTLDSGIAIAEVIITAATVFFYGITAILAALYDSCPFTTQVSKYLSFISRSSLKATKTLTGHPHIRQMPPTHVTSESELQALLWLTENARDPEVGDCACQALKGFRNIKAATYESKSTQESEANSIDLTPRALYAKSETRDSAESVAEAFTEASFEDIGHELSAESTNSLAYLTPSRFALIKKLFDAIHMRFSQARLRLPQECMDNGGMHMAQYASLMPALVLALERDMKNAIDSLQGSKKSHGHVTTPTAAPALHALDGVWRNQCPELSPDAYATLTAAELQLTESVTLAHHAKQPTPFAPVHIQSPSYTAVAIHPILNKSLLSNISLLKLKARYSRALSRAGYLLSYHNNYDQRISSQPLIYLLKAIRQAALREELNPDDHMSTCLPQSNNTSLLPEFRVQVASSGLSHWVRPLYLGDEDGIISGLVQVLASAGINGNSPVEFVAGNCLATVGPMLFRQWLRMMEEQQKDQFNGIGASIAPVTRLLSHWPTYRETEELEGVVRWALTQLLVVFGISLALSGYPQVSDLKRIATNELCQRAKTKSGRIVMSELLSEDDQLIRLIIPLVEGNQDRLGPSSQISLLELFLTQHPDSKNHRNLTVAPSILPRFLSFLADVPGSAEKVDLVLDDLQKTVEQECDTWRKRPGPYISLFFRKEEGLCALAGMANQQAYVSATVNCITRIVHCAAHQGFEALSKQGGLGEPAVSGLLDAVRAVIGSVANETSESSTLEPFMTDVMLLLRPLHDSGGLTEDQRQTLAEVYDTLDKLEGLPEEDKLKLSELEDWRYGGDTLRNIRWLFEESP